MRRLILLPMVLSAIGSGTAQAQDPASGTAGPSGTTGATGAVLAPVKPVPVTRPKPADVRLSIATPGRLRIKGRAIALSGQLVRITGRMTPYVEGAGVTVRVTRAGKLVMASSRRVERIPGSSSGRFTMFYRPGKAGPVTIRASRRATTTATAAASGARRVSVIEPHANSGDSGLNVRFLQQRLYRLHFAVPVDGVYKGSTERAVLAYRKVSGLGRVTNANERVFYRLYEGKGRFVPRFKHQGRHVEGDLTHQVLALINADGSVFKVFHMSSGKPSTPTILGTFRVYRRELGTNAHGMVDSSYFIRGYAIHGYHEVPTYAASHGCLRVPVPSARFIHDHIRMGETVDVYYR